MTDTVASDPATVSAGCLLLHRLASQAVCERQGPAFTWAQAFRIAKGVFGVLARGSFALSGCWTRSIETRDASDRGVALQALCSALYLCQIIAPYQRLADFTTAPARGAVWRSTRRPSALIPRARERCGKVCFRPRLHLSPWGDWSGREIHLQDQAFRPSYP